MKHAQAIKEFVIEEYLPDVSAGELDDGYDLVDGGVIDSLTAVIILYAVLGVITLIILRMLARRWRQGSPP